jgi:hypothetical protein
VTQLRPAEDASPADWIVADLQTFGESVLSLLPAGFPAYVRLVHPARPSSTARKSRCAGRRSPTRPGRVPIQQACRDVLLAAREFEALAIDPASGIDMYSDPVNTSPTA